MWCGGVVLCGSDVVWFGGVLFGLVWCGVLYCSVVVWCGGVD